MAAEIGRLDKNLRGRENQTCQYTSMQAINVCIISKFVLYSVNGVILKNEEQMQQASILNSEIIEGLRGLETVKRNANEDVKLEKK